MHSVFKKMIDRQFPKPPVSLVAFALGVSFFAFVGCGGGGGGTTTTTGTTTGGTRMSGRVIDSASLSGVPNVTVRFFDASGTVGSGVTNSSGVYTISVSRIPTKVHLPNVSWPAAYYKEFYYRTKWYLPTQSTCQADIPTVTPNVVNTLTDIEIVPGSEPPPPPPSGCP